ncbi:pilus assembly protein HofN [Enterobacter sp. RHBSTW-00994]|nr:pilus assembly protein HofN [Enterobacter sp. RHBSTW-00994]
MRTMNLLPWRQYQQAHCVRFWGLMFAGSLSIVLMLMVSLRVGDIHSRHVLQRELSGIQTVQNRLEARLMREQDVAQPDVDKWFPTQVWPPALLSLAHIIPSQAWLTQLRYQPPSLILTGYATTLPVLSGMNVVLSKIEGFTPGPAGALLQDNQGRWAFTFQLKKRG